jgi:VWFA-related protein
MNYMPEIRSLLATLLCVVLLPTVTPAQQPAAAPTQTPAANPPQPSADSNTPTDVGQEVRFTGEAKEVAVPVTVMDRDGSIINGLKPYQFHITDNGKDQDIHVDVSYEPISLVVAIQANASVDAILPQVRKIPELLNASIVGEAGEAAIIAFDHRIQVLQPFTNDGTKITEAVKKIHAGSYTSRMVDALEESIRLLKNRPKDRRRVILLISETRDLGSEGKKKRVLTAAELNDVQVWAVDMSRFVELLTGKAKPPRPDPMPATARQGVLPPGVPATPTTVESTFQLGNRIEFVPLFKEVLRDVRDVFVDNPVELMTKGTGGEEFSFYNQRALENAIQRIGSELHSQYMITYTPNNPEEAGFHDIEVNVTGVRNAKVRARPGYWVAAKFTK